MRYPGGKFRCYQKLINLIPPHRVYIETHLGGGAVLRNKAPAEFSVGIERDPEIVRTFIGKFDSSHRFITGTAEEFLKTFAFKGDEFIYSDPPYWPTSRRSLRSPYRYDYTAAQHLAFLRLLKRLPCRIMLSGYASPAYARELAGWNTFLFKGTSHAGLREEIVWMNYHPTLLHDTRYLGNTYRDRQSVRRKRERWLARFIGEPIAIQQALLADLTKLFTAQAKRGVPPK
jgi:DNA adenine methylase